VLIALPALGTDLFVPALPVLARDLGVEVAAAQLTLTTYFFGLAGGQPEEVRGQRELRRGDLDFEAAREHRQRRHEQIGAERRQRDQHAEKDCETRGSFLLIQVRIPF